MSDSRTYRLFISHAWNYNAEYIKFTEYLREAKSFNYINNSITNTGKMDPDNKEALKESLRKQIRPADVVIILAGMYAKNSEWIDFEVEFARIWNKPIIVVKPWDNSAVPPELSLRTYHQVGWSTGLIVSTIKNAY